MSGDFVVQSEVNKALESISNLNSYNFVDAYDKLLDTSINNIEIALGNALRFLDPLYLNKIKSVVWQMMLKRLKFLVKGLVFLYDNMTDNMDASEGIEERNKVMNLIKLAYEIKVKVRYLRDQSGDSTSAFRLFLKNSS